MGKVNQRELRKKLKFDHTNKWYMQNSESVQANEMHKLLWDVEIQTGLLISARRPDLVITKKKKKRKKKRKKKKKKKRELAELWTCQSGWPQSKLKESKKKDKNTDITKQLKKL